MTPQETDPDLLVSVQESPAEVWVGGGLRSLSVAVRAWDLLKTVHYLHYVHDSLASGQTTGKEHNLTHKQKLD